MIGRGQGYLIENVGPDTTWIFPEGGVLYCWYSTPVAHNLYYKFLKRSSFEDKDSSLLQDRVIIFNMRNNWIFELRYHLTIPRAQGQQLLEDIKEMLWLYMMVGKGPIRWYYATNLDKSSQSWLKWKSCFLLLRFVLLAPQLANICSNIWIWYPDCYDLHFKGFILPTLVAIKLANF